MDVHLNEFVLAFCIVVNLHMVTYKLTSLVPTGSIICVSQQGATVPSERSPPPPVHPTPLLESPTPRLPPPQYPVSPPSPCPPRVSPMRPSISWRTLQTDYMRLKESHDQLAERVVRLEELFLEPINTLTGINPSNYTFSELVPQPSSQQPASLGTNQLGVDSNDISNHHPLPPQTPVSMTATTTTTSSSNNALLAASDVIKKYPKLVTLHKAPTLAVKLARQSTFGDNLMARSTVMGCREYGALPTEALNKQDQLKIHVHAPCAQLT